MTPQPSEQRAALRERLRKLDDTPHDSWPRWTYRDYVNVSNLLAEAEAAAPDPVASPAPVDVERLALALDVLSADGDEYALMAPEDREYRYEAAERLAAAYAEGQPVAEEAGL